MRGAYRARQVLSAMPGLEQRDDGPSGCGRLGADAALKDEDGTAPLEGALKTGRVFDLNSPAGEKRCLGNTSY